MMASLYVGGLHPEVTESMLAERFSPAGHIRSIRVCRDRKTGSSLCYAYINFQKRVDAVQALEMFNFKLLMGQPMRVMWLQRDPSQRKNGIGNIFIKNLDKSTDNLELYELFSTFGKVLSCKTVGYETGPKGYGYVHFESVEAADLAIKTLNGKLLNNRKVYIEHFKAREERKTEVGHCPSFFNSIYVKNLGEEVDNNMMADIFSKLGPVLRVNVVTDENGKCRGFGFVRFVRHEDAQRAVTEMNGTLLNGKLLYIARSMTKMEKLKYKSEQAQKLAAYDTPSQKVEPCPDLLRTCQAMWPVSQSVQYMPDVVPPASVHQQTGSTIAPSVSQVPYMGEECTPGTTQTPVDAVQVQDMVPTIDTAPFEDTLSLESVLDEDIRSSIESVLAEDPRPSLETLSDDNILSLQGVSAEDALQSPQSVQAKDCSGNVPFFL